MSLPEEAAAQAVFEHCHIFFLLLNTDVSAFASTSKGSSTEACPARPFGEESRYISVVIGRRRSIYSQLLDLPHCLLPLASQQE